MKILTLVSALFFFCQYAEAKDNQPKQSQPKQQSGAFYGGINSNYTYGNNYVNSFIRAGYEDISKHLFYIQGSEVKRMSHSGFGFGGFIGYAHRLNKIILMGDVSYDQSKLKQQLSKQEMYAYAPPFDSPFPLNTNYSIIFKRDNTWSGNLRLGCVITPSIVVFAKAGLLLSTFHLTFSSEELSKSDKKNLLGIEPGMGFDISLPNDVFFRGEYGLQSFKKFTTKNIDSHLIESDNKVIYSVSPRYHVIRIGIGYKFKTY